MTRFLALAAAILGSSLLAASSTASGEAPQASGATKDPSVVCKYVVSDEPGTKPFQMCLTKAEWALKELQDSKDPNRIVCRYEQSPGSRVTSRKICQPASAWAEQERLDRAQVEDLQMRTCVMGAGC